MTEPIRLVVCRHFVRELNAVVRATGYTEVVVTSFADLCMHPQATRRRAAAELMETVRSSDHPTVMLGACFMSSDAVQLREAPPERVIFRDQCFHLLANRRLIDQLMAQGAYLLTPGWLEHWERHIEQWGFDRPTAREFFQEATRRLVMLDTEVDPRARDRLAEFGAFLDLPAEVLPVGLEYLTLEVERIVLRHRLRRSRVAEGGRPGADQRLADYSMAFDLLGSLTRIMSEEESSRAIVDMFAMLFGARRVTYVPVVDGQPGEPTSASPERGVAARARAHVDALGARAAYVQTADGFCVRVTSAGETLGILGIEGFTFPERKADYLNLTLGIAGLCGLAVANARAMTTIRQTENALRARTGELEASNRDLTQFAYVASHDLQEPLRTITGFLQLLQRRYAAQLDDKANQYIDITVDGANRMRRLIRDLLTYSRIETRGQPLTPVPLLGPLEEARASLAAAVDEADATITWDPLPTVLGDAGQLTQLLQNLLGNAIKFRGDRPPAIHVGAVPEDGGWRVTVRDNGIGIEPEYADQIFEVFKRLHGVKDYEGSGIGLAVCRRIMERHQGRIWVESTPGAGTSFHLTLLDGEVPPDAPEPGA